MKMKAATIDEYINNFPLDIQGILEKIRSIIQKAAPESTEAISYGMPTFKFNGNLIHFAAFKNHIGLYPTPSGIAAFSKDLSPYRSSKGAVQFPLTQPIPYDLIRKITELRVRENAKKI